MTESTHRDAIVIGAGFAGMYMLIKLRQMGLNALGLESGPSVGGTWYWNRYPGARCDVESLFYCYSFDEELQQNWDWRERYPQRDEILAYANHVADKYQLRDVILFNHDVSHAAFSEDENCWKVKAGGKSFTARYLISAVGCLSAPNTPKIPGLEDFRGPIYHTADWPEDGVDFTGLRIGQIGTGSSGIQAAPIIAEQAEQLVVFQRTPNFSIPAHNKLLSEEEKQQVRFQYEELREAARHTPDGILYDPTDKSAFDLTPAEQKIELDRRWDKGGFAFIAAFTDMLTDEQANEIAAEYVRDHIRQRVKDPEVAEQLCPTDHPIGTKRICLDTDYYETFNRDNVQLVDLKKDKIETINATGVQVSSGQWDLDALVLATGFDAMTGALNKIDIQGIDGTTLRDAWKDGPETYLGLTVHGFPNFFIITGPGSPSVLTNMIVAIEQHVEWISDFIRFSDERGINRFDVKRNAQHEWTEHVQKVASETLYPSEIGRAHV